MTALAGKSRLSMQPGPLQELFAKIKSGSLRGVSQGRHNGGREERREEYGRAFFVPEAWPTNPLHPWLCKNYKFGDKGLDKLLLYQVAWKETEKRRKSTSPLSSGGISLDKGNLAR
jgi:hypothetical protein